MNTFNWLNPFIGCFLVVLQVSGSWCADNFDFSQAVVRIVSGNKFLCAGTLVSDKYVVTSAKCAESFRGIWFLKVVGNFGLRTSTVGASSGIDKTYIPKDYNKVTGEMNVAVLKLKKPFTVDYIKSAELCDLGSFAINGTANIYDWAEHQLQTRTIIYLRENEHTITPNSNCATAYNRPLTDSMFCVKNDLNLPDFRNEGLPAAIRRRLCGIYDMVPGYTGESNLYIFTSLANAGVQEYIKQIVSQPEKKNILDYISCTTSM